MAAGLTLGGCASDAALRAPRTQDGAPPWVLPTAAERTQRLFRFSYDGPEGDGGGRLTLRLVTASTFRLDVADRLGRNHWTLAAWDGELLWFDRDRGIFCRDLRRLPLPGLGEAPIDPVSVSRLLLGRVPATPTGIEESVGDGRFQDGLGRTWSYATTRDGEVRRWTMSTSGEPRWWWRRDEAGAVLSQREAGRQLRWQQVVVEPLPEPLERLQIPSAAAERCDVL